MHYIEERFQTMPWDAFDSAAPLQGDGQAAVRPVQLP